MPDLRQSDADLDTAAYRRDLWPRDTLRLIADEQNDAPERVVWPRDDDEVAAALRLAADRDLAVVPYGAGSGVCGGAQGRARSMALDLKAMGRILELDTEARTVRVQPGVLGQHLEDWLGVRGWMTAHSPSSISCSTVGGWVAARSAGQFSSRYGVVDDMLLAARAVTPTGTIRAGAWTPDGEEDLLPVLCGSEGGLGVLTELMLRVAPHPEKRWLRGYAFPNLPSAWTAMRRIMQAGLWPSAMRLYDPLDTALNRTTKDKKPHKQREGVGLLGRMREALTRVPTLRGHLADLPLALPGLVNSMVGGLGDEVAMILGFEGPAAVVDAQVAVAQTLLTAGRDLGAGPGERWFGHRHGVSYKLAPVFIAGGFADTMEVAAPWSRLEALHDGVRQAIARHGLVMAHFSHAYPEGCSIYFSFAARGELATYDALWTDALDAAAAAGGTVTHHHGVGQLKSRAAAREAGHALRVWWELKDRLDPEDRMNPGRPFARGVEPAPGPPPDTGSGPVFTVDRQSLMADVDPQASPAELDAALAERGYQLRIRVDRPLARWLPALDRRALDAWECPVFAVQVRFADGASARVGPAPRSAAGPDFRPALLRRAVAERVQVAIRPLTDAPDIVLRPPAGHADARDVRPTWRKDGRWGFAPELEPVADAVGGEPARGRSPRRHPAEPRPPELNPSEPNPSEPRAAAGTETE
ncbi:MAG: FAD-binding protein [Alphaproteobacteria bacterium]|nr:FAD-binding protein [Alphaproteobacteria bacterium]